MYMSTVVFVNTNVLCSSVLTKYHIYKLDKIIVNRLFTSWVAKFWNIKLCREQTNK